MKKGITLDKLFRAAKINREVGMWFKYFLIYGFPEERASDHRKTEEVVRKTRPDSVCLSLLQPIPGTAVYEQLKPLLIKDVAEIEFHYWHSTETFKHPNFTHEELHAEREELLKVHAKQASKLSSRLLRKWERLVAMIKHPVLIADYIEVAQRKRAHRRRVASSEWRHTLTRDGRDLVALQVPTVRAE